MNIRRKTLTIALIAIGLSTIAAPAVAGSFDSNNPLGPDAFVVLTGRLDLPRGLVASDAIIFNGDAAIAGDVTNNVVAFNGDVEVTGHVGENVVALNGRVTLGPGAQVDGDVVSSDTADISPNATVGGRVRPVRSFDVNLGQFTVVSRILVWLATSVSSFLLGLLLVLFVPRAMDATARTGIDRQWWSAHGPSRAFAALHCSPLRRDMKAMRSNRCKSCSFFNSAPASGGINLRLSVSRRVSGETSSFNNSLIQSSSSEVDGFFLTPGTSRIS